MSPANILLSSIFFLLMQDGLSKGETIAVDHEEKNCTGEMSGNNSFLSVQWNKANTIRCDVYFAPTSPEYRACLRIRETDVYQAKIIVEYIKDNYHAGIVIRVISDRNAPNSIICAKQGTKLYVRLRQSPIGGNSPQPMDSTMIPPQNSSSSRDQVTTMNSGQSLDHADGQQNQNSSFTIYTVNAHKVKIEEYCNHGYSRLDYVVDRLPLLVIWKIWEATSCTVNFHPSSGQTVCVIVKHLNIYNSIGTFVDFKHLVDGKLSRIDKLDFISFPGMKVCAGKNKMLVAKFCNMDYLYQEWNSSIAFEVLEETIPVESDMSSVWIVAVLLPISWLTAIIIYIRKRHQLKDDQVFHDDLTPKSSQNTTELTTEVSCVRDDQPSFMMYHLS